MQSFPALNLTDVYREANAFGQMCDGYAARARCLLETAEITAFNIGETDEKYVWFGSGEIVGARNGDISGPDDIRLPGSCRS